MLLALTTILVGFAHRPLAGFPTAIEIVAAAGIVRAAVCGVAPADAVAGSEASHASLHAALCDACLVCASPGVAASAAAMPVPPEWRVIGRVVAVDAAPRGVDRPRASARGPPGVV